MIQLYSTQSIKGTFWINSNPYSIKYCLVIRFTYFPQLLFKRPTTIRYQLNICCKNKVRVMKNMYVCLKILKQPCVVILDKVPTFNCKDKFKVQIETLYMTNWLKEIFMVGENNILTSTPCACHNDRSYWVLNILTINDFSEFLFGLNSPT